MDFSCGSVSWRQKPLMQSGRIANDRNPVCASSESGLRGFPRGGQASQELAEVEPHGDEVALLRSLRGL